MRVVAIILIVLGLVGLIWGGISYTTREEVVDFGPIEVTAEEKKTIPLPPLAGGLCLGVGVALLFAGRKG